MRILNLFLFLIGLQWAIAEPAKEEIKLSGIVNLPDFKLAVLKAPNRNPLWMEGQREGSLAIRRIDPESGSVEGAINKTNPVTFRFEKQPVQPIQPPTIQLENISLNELLSLYGLLSKQTLLQSPSLPRLTFSAQTTTTNRSEVLALIERLLLEQEISLIRDGEKFVAILPQSRGATVQAKRAPCQAERFSRFVSARQPKLPQWHSFSLFAHLEPVMDFG